VNQPSDDQRKCVSIESQGSIVDYLERVGKGRKIFTALLVFQCLIVITGGIVRITGSGLGCPTWPECAPGSYTPSPDQSEDPLHIWIEFGNRLLTFVLGFAALASLLYSLRFIPNLRIRLLALGQFLGILAQAILGGITVLTGLHPITVAAHLLLSIILISGALSLRQRVYGRIPKTFEVQPLTRLIAKVLVALGFAVIVVGTIVTGTGPHAGDVSSERFDFDIRVVAWLHADLVIAFLGLTLATWIAVRLGEVGPARSALERRIVTVLAISLSQGALGYIQYFTGVPELLVIFHLIGAVSVWLSLWNFYITGSVTSQEGSRSS
jgi:cytochrome c oxidase assembly protein subunit 15